MHESITFPAARRWLIVAAFGLLAMLGLLSALYLTYPIIGAAMMVVSLPYVVACGRARTVLNATEFQRFGPWRTQGAQYTEITNVELCPMSAAIDLLTFWTPQVTLRDGREIKFDIVFGTLSKSKAMRLVAALRQRAGMSPLDPI